MDFPQLTSNILVTHNVLQSNAMRAINQNITARNWLVGYWIVEFEQNGEDRAKYGDKLIPSLAKAIHIKGLGTVMLNLCRKFYKTYSSLGIEVGKYLISENNSQKDGDNLININAIPINITILTIIIYMDLLLSLLLLYFISFNVAFLIHLLLNLYFLF